MGRELLSHQTRTDSRRASMVSTVRLGCGDSLELALAPEVGFEFSEYFKHVKEGLARRAMGVDGLLGRLE